MTVVSTRDFRTNQTKYLNMAQAGEDIILRSRAGSFKITPITEDDSLTSKTTLEASLRHALQEVVDAKKGNLKLKSAEEILSEL